MTKPFLSAWGRGAKLGLLAASVWPLLYMGLFMVVWLLLMLNIGGAPRPGAGRPDEVMGWMGGLFALHCLTMLVIVGLLVAYVVDVFRNPRLADNVRPLWAVVLFLGNMLAFPIYWYLYVWRAPQEGGAPPVRYT